MNNLNNDTLLNKIFSDQQCLGKFLHMLSYMEYLGSLRIMKSHKPEYATMDVLQHAFEEVRHAFYVKRMAQKFCDFGEGYTKESLLSKAGAEMYFGRLEAGIKKHLQPNDHISLLYLYTTKIVEMRALSFYKILEACIQRFELSLSLKGLLAEEEKHLEQMDNTLKQLDPKFSERWPQFQKYEHGLYEKLIRTVSSAVDEHFSNQQQAA